MPNFSTSLFESMLILESTNSFSTLYNSSHIHSPDSPGTPQMTSSPKLSKEHNNKITKHRRRPLPNDTEKVRIMVVNCQSLRRRKDILQTSIAQIRTDVIIGTESWLDPSIKDGDIFPEEFKGNVYRKDRKSHHHGGVFVAIKNTFDSEEAEELKSTAEIIWAKLTLPSGSKLYIGSMYHPHTANTASMEEIQRNIRLASSNDKHTVWIGVISTYPR